MSGSPKPAKKAASGQAARMRMVRQIHLWAGMLFAPSIIFFAITGGLQLFKLHESSRDGAYAPPAVIEKLGEVHIHQRFAVRPKRPEAPKAAAPSASAPKAVEKPAAPKPFPFIKWFFLATSVGLACTTGLGVWIGLTQGRNRPLALGLLILGCVAPVLMLAL